MISQSTKRTGLIIQYQNGNDSFGTWLIADVDSKLSLSSNMARRRVIVKGAAYSLPPPKSRIFTFRKVHDGRGNSNGVQEGYNRYKGNNDIQDMNYHKHCVSNKIILGYIGIITLKPCGIALRPL